ncbi:uncharacterized protein LOC135201378 [Macrobrachium nipponense]|uniref:uncharacterized protein LOC135201378 n=1 Tax=Macrobrachium nipponense TaxID=159736 RepID=UPI0030C7F108
MMSESDRCPSDHPSSSPSSSATIFYMQRNCVPQQEIIGIQSGMFRMPSVKPCIVPQNFCKSENSSSNCTQFHDRNVNEVGRQRQEILIHTHNDVAGTSLNYKNSEKSVKRGNVQSVSVCPSTSLGIKRKHAQVSHRNVYGMSKNCKCSHDDSYTTGYTSDDSEEDNLHSKRYRSRTHQNVGLMKAYPSSFSKREIDHCGGRPLLRDKALKDSHTPTKQCPTYFQHLKQDPDFGCTSKYEMEPVWEERKFQLAIREQQICKAEEALKQEEEKAQECLKLALQQQELALNEREEALRIREAAVQRKLEQATKLFEESRKAVDSNKLRIGKGTRGFIGHSSDPTSSIGHSSDQTSKFSYPLQFSHDNHDILSTNFEKNPTENSNEDQVDQINLGNKDIFKGLNVDKRHPLSEKVPTIEKKCDLSLLSKSDTYTVSSPKQEISSSSSSSFTRNTFLSEDVQGLHHVSEKCENKPSLEPGKVVRTYTRANKFQPVSETSGPSVLCKTDASIPPRAHSVTPIAKSSLLASNSLCSVGAVCNEETVINGGASVTITPLTASDRPPRSFSAIPKLECSLEYEDEQCEEPSKPLTQMFTPVDSIADLESKGTSICNNQTKDKPVLDQFKVLPSKYVNLKPVPPVEKCDSQRLLNHELKSETSIYSYDALGSSGAAESKGNSYTLNLHSNSSMSLKGGLYPGAIKMNSSCGKKKANLSMRTLAVISIPGCEKEDTESQDHCEVKLKPHNHGYCKSAECCKTDVNLSSPNVNDVGITRTQNFVCGTRDMSEAAEESLNCVQNSVDTAENFDTRESTLAAIDKMQVQSGVPCCVEEQNPQSLGRNNTQQWHGRPFLPGDILYTPANKLNSQITLPSVKDTSVSKVFFHVSQDSKSQFSSKADTPEFKHMSAMPSRSLQCSKELGLSNSKLNQSLNNEATFLTYQSSRTGRDTSSPYKNEVKPVLLTSTPKTPVSSVQGATLSFVSAHCYSSSPPRKHTEPPSFNSVQLPSSPLVDSTLSRNSIPGPCVANQQNVVSTTSSNSHESPSTHNMIYSNSSLMSNSIQSCSSVKAFKEVEQKSFLKNCDRPGFVDETPSSEKLPQVLIVSSAGTQGLPMVQGAGEQTGSSNIQSGPVSLQVGNISLVRGSQPLDFQESRTPCNSQWSSNFNTPVSEVLTNLGDYDPVSQTLTTSNPMFLQSILASTVSAGLTSNSLVTSMANHSPNRIGEVPAGQSTVQLQTEDACGNSQEPMYNSGFTQDPVDTDEIDMQGSDDKDDDDKILEKDDHTCTNISLMGSNKSQISVCHAERNTSSISDIDCIPQALSDVEGVSVKYSPIKLHDATSDTSRNFSDSESEFSRTGDRFFISTGILRTQDLTKPASSVQDGYIETESNLHDNCYSDSDDGCKVEETGMDVCSPINHPDELEEGNSRFEEEREVKDVSDCERPDGEISGILESGSVNLYAVSDAVVGEDCNKVRLIENNARLGETPLGNKTQDSSYTLNKSVLDVTETEMSAQNSDNMENTPKNNELMSFNSFSPEESHDPIASLNKEPSQITCEERQKNSRISKRRRGRRRRGLSTGSGRNRSKSISNKNIKSDLFSKSQSEICKENLSYTKDDVMDNEIDGSPLGSSLSESETKLGLSLVSNPDKELEGISGKDRDSDVKKVEEAPEPEKFEHVSHSGRKLKLRSYLMKAVSKSNVRKQTSAISQSKADETVLPKVVNRSKSVKGGRPIKKAEDIEGRKVLEEKVVCEKDPEIMNEDCDSNRNRSHKSAANSNLKCGKCDYISGSVAKFNYHAQHEHNGLARPYGESQEFSEEEWNSIISSTMRSMKKLKCEICAKIFRSLGGYKYHVKFCGHTVEEVLTTCSLCMKQIRQHNLQVHMRRYHGQKIRKRAEVPAPVEQDLDGPRPRRKAATNCNAKLKGWRSDHAEVNDSDVSEDGDGMCDEIGISKFYEKEKVVVPKEIQTKWEEDIKLNGKANCMNSSCSYNFKNVRSGHKHYANCPFSSISRKYKCKSCSYTCGSEAEFRVHFSVKHKDLTEQDLESDYDLSDEETRTVNPRLAGKPRVVSKQLIDQMRPFEPALNWTFEFMLENYSEELFVDFTVSAADWVLLNEEEARKYVPSVDISPKFKVSMVSKIESRNQCTDWQVLDRFCGTSIYEGYVLFSGGPTLASAWCPLPLKDSIRENFQFLALSASSYPEKKYSVQQSYSHEGVIQIWKCPSNVENEGAVPQFQLGIAHNFGAVWSLVWCPSGIYNVTQSVEFNNDSNLQKIGLLAAACSDGSIRILAVPNPAQLELQGTSQIFRVNPKLTLRPTGLSDGNAQCLKVDWFRGKGHRYIAGAYSAGFVCIWDVHTSSPILRVTDSIGDILYPVNSFLAHNGVCSTVSFCPTTQGRNLLSGGNDRTYKFWDLENTNMPLSMIRKGLVTDSCWISHWGGCFVAFDDVYGLSNTNTCFKENGFYGIHSRNVLSSNSPVWTISGSEWMNTLVQGDAAGEVVITLQQQLFKNYENEKVPSKRKVPLLAVKLEKLGSGTSVALSERNRMKFQQKNKKGPMSSQGESNSEEDGLSSVVYLDLPRTYLETCDGYGVVFAEQDYHNFADIPEAQLMERKRSERMEPGPLDFYPLMSAATVSWNNNFLSHSWVLIGTQSGLCRLVSVKAMINGTTNLTESIRKKIESLNSGRLST